MKISTRSVHRVRGDLKAQASVDGTTIIVQGPDLTLAMSSTDAKSLWDALGVGIAVAKYNASTYVALKAVADAS